MRVSRLNFQFIRVMGLMIGLGVAVGDVNVKRLEPGGSLELRELEADGGESGLHRNGSQHVGQQDPRTGMDHGRQGRDLPPLVYRI